MSTEIDMIVENTCGNRIARSASATSTPSIRAGLRSSRDGLRGAAHPLQTAKVLRVGAGNEWKDA